MACGQADELRSLPWAAGNGRPFAGRWEDDATSFMRGCRACCGAARRWAPCAPAGYFAALLFSSSSSFLLCSSIYAFSAALCLSATMAYFSSRSFFISFSGGRTCFSSLCCCYLFCSAPHSSTDTLLLPGVTLFAALPAQRSQPSLPISIYLAITCLFSAPPVTTAPVAAKSRQAADDLRRQHVISPYDAKRGAARQRRWRVRMRWWRFTNVGAALTRLSGGVLRTAWRLAGWLWAAGGAGTRVTGACWSGVAANLPLVPVLSMVYTSPPCSYPSLYKHFFCMLLYICSLSILSISPSASPPSLLLMPSTSHAAWLLPLVA